jgi:hypothetical protein
VSNHQSLISNHLRKSKQHFTAHHFFNAHKLRIRISILTFSAASASMRRCFSNRNLSQCQKVHCLIITYTHTSDLQQFEIYQNAIERSNVQIKPLTQCLQTFSPHFAPQTRVEVSQIEWVNLT